MRLHFTLSPNTEPVPFAYQHRLIGAFHKWLSDNNLHDAISLYSLAWLDGSRTVANHLEFPRGAKWFVSFFEDEHVEKLVGGALKDPEMFCGMRVERIEQQTAPDFGTKYKFKVASPVFVKGKMPADGKPPHHYLYNEPEADALMTATLIHKMDAANREAGKEIFTEPDRQIKIVFDREFSSPKIKLVRIKEINHKASICPIIVEGTPKSLQFAWNVGIGNGTGSCFGSLKENLENA
ncbi:MAG: CRISPR-associated protein Cas6 [Acidobacteria bacterium]|nr:CRISPR-associated protein Cas6 [Acidobacteriota bacterium]